VLNRDKQFPVIFSTAYLDEEKIERAKITMPFGYVLKPIQERDLKVTIEMALYISKVDDERKKVEEHLKENAFFLNRAQEMGQLGFREITTNK
jgi:AmiR/NasT family two-component response regulator